MKREHEQEDDRNNRNKRPRGDGFMDAIQHGKFEMRLLVSSKSAGGIIGKGGEMIKRLRAECDAQVQVPDSNSPERVCTITAEDEKVVKVVKEILPRLEDNMSERDPCEVRILIHQSHAGALIGRSGSKIKELREKYSVRLKIFSMCAPGSTDRVLLTSGEYESCLSIIEYIIKEIKSIPIKGSSTPYCPYNYDPSRTTEYGGFPGGQGGGGDGGDRGDRGHRGGGRSGGPRGMPPGGHGGPHRGLPGPPRGGYGGGGGRGGGDYGFRGGPPAPYPMHGGASGGGGYGGGGGGGYNQNGYGFGGPSGGGGATTTAQVTIPSDLGGTIIGRGGERIARIRQDSGAQITLEQSNGQSERIITITGTEQQIHSAQYLLQQCVRSSQAGRERFGGA